jgi:hypothetical protein
METTELKQVFYSNKASFVLRNKHSERPTSVYLLFKLHNKQYKINVGAKVYPNQFNNCILTNFNVNDMRNNNILLQKINKKKETYNKMIEYLCNIENNNIDYNDVVSRFFNYKIMKTKQQTLIQMLSTHIYVKDIKDSSKRQYEYIVSSFESFLNEKRIDNKITNATYDTLLQYQQFLHNEKKLSGSTINIFITVIQRLLKLASKNYSVYHYNVNDSRVLDIDKLKTKKKEDVYTLTDKQINDLYYSKNEMLSAKEHEILDIFIFECLTGQRISDVPFLMQGGGNIEEENGMKFIVYNNTKTESKCYVPITKEVYEMREKYKCGYKYFSLNNKRYDNYINVQLKTIFKKLGYTDDFNGTPIYKCIHTHIGRHTFVTNACRRGLSKDLIILCTGHADTTMIDEIYNNMQIREKVERFADDLNKTSTQTAKTTTTTDTTIQAVINLTRDNEHLKEDNKVLKNDNEHLNNKIEQRQYEDELNDFIEQGDDPQELANDTAKDNLIEMLKDKLISVQEYNKALQDPQYFEDLYNKIHKIHK